MTIQRIVSFLPSATELLYELGAEEKLFGVTHECLYPEDAKSKPRVIDSVFDPSKMTSRQIDDKITELSTTGQDIYILQEKNLSDAKPDLIISQEICHVCSAYSSQVNKAMDILDKKPEVYAVDPHDLEGIFTSITDIAKKIQKQGQGEELVSSLRKRVNYIKNKKNFHRTPKVLGLEWLDPFFTTGHWVPEMIEVAGAINLVSSKKDHSRQMTFDEIASSDPEIIVLMPCGFDTDRTIREYQTIFQKDKKWNQLSAVKENKVYAVDANSYFSKPSLRTITGIEILAKIIHPEIFGDLAVPKNSFSRIKT